MNRLSEIYADSGIVIRTKAPQVFVVLVVISALMPFVITNDVIQGDYLNAGIEIFIVATMLTSLAMLFRGHFRFAAIAPLALATAAVVGLAALVEPKSSFQVFAVAMYLTPAVILSLVMSENEWPTAIAAGVGLLTIGIVSFLKIGPTLRLTDPNATVVDHFIVATVVFLLVSVFSFLIATANRRALQNAESASAEVLRTLENVARVSNDAKSSLDATNVIESDYAEIQSRAGQITEQVEVVERSIANLQEDVTSALGSVRATADLVLQFHEQVDEQNTVVQESTASVNEMSASLDSVAQITASKKSASELLLKLVSEGQQAIEETNVSFQTANREMSSLLEINQIISDIAAQTNLLSMNAAIEAAHAGDSGRGFAVVAEEIRKLATSTSENSQIISDNLKRLMDSISATNHHAEVTSGSMARISAEVREVALAFDEITGSTAELSQGGREIMRAMTVLQDSSVKVRDGSDEIARDQQSARAEMEHVGQIVHAIEGAATEVTQAVGAISESITSLHQTIVASRTQSAKLHDSISRLIAGNAPTSSHS